MSSPGEEETGEADNNLTSGHTSYDEIVFRTL